MKKRWKVKTKKVIFTVTESTTTCGGSKRETSVIIKVTEVPSK